MSYERGIHVFITGKDIAYSMFLPQVPSKGDILWLGSLTRGEYNIPAVLVSRVEWSMEQRTGIVDAWVKVRRLPTKTEGTSAD